MSSDTDTPTRKPLKLSSPGKLELKKTVDGGQVRGPKPPPVDPTPAQPVAGQNEQQPAHVEQHDAQVRQQHRIGQQCSQGRGGE